MSIKKKQILMIFLYTQKSLNKFTIKTLFQKDIHKLYTIHPQFNVEHHKNKFIVVAPLKACPIF